ncbi:MAG: transketolase, partial [Citromicrobium sp.]
QSLRLMPNLLVMRPADAVETAECWDIALRQKDRPTVLALTRQNLPQVRNSPDDGNLSARGAYRLKRAGNKRRVILIATGSEVHVALECAEMLEKQGIGADVISMVCTELFDEQDAAYRSDLLPDVDPAEVLRVSIEAGTTFGWERYTMANGLNIGIDRFGASAPAGDLFEKFGLTADKIVPQIMNKLND